MYKLYWHPYASSYAPMAVLEELGVEFELHEVDYDGGETSTAEYRRVQPLGLIPALGLADGRSMFESAAIILYLCDLHQGVDLAPSTTDEAVTIYNGCSFSPIQSTLLTTGIIIQNATPLPRRALRT